MKRTNKKGISLIVLVITIIVMIILAAAIIITLSNNGIINKANEAVNLTNMKQVQQIAQVIWAEGFTDELRGTALESYVKTELAKQDITEDKFNITVTDKGVEITAKEDGSAVTSEWVTTTVDGVPIPKGFVASGATGENTKAGGLVIYEGTDAVTDINVDTARRTRNQYVWVPIDKENFKTEFVRDLFGYNDWVIYNELGAGLEPVPMNYKEKNSYNLEFLSFNNVSTTYDKEGVWEVELDENNMPKETQSDMSYMSLTTLSEVQEMYASVKKYGGFYIARYEAGKMPTITGTFGRSNVGVMMNLEPINDIPWSESETMNVDTNGAVEVARSLYTKADSNYGVVSTLTYGVQWDAVVQWLKDKGMNILDSTAYGNYYNHEIKSSTELNEGAKYAEYQNWEFSDFNSIPSDYTKSNVKHLYTTGALKAAKVNNIYDMAGNLEEWTMEGYSSNDRPYRGGSFGEHGADFPVASRFSLDGPTVSHDNLGFRSALYIK